MQNYFTLFAKNDNKSSSSKTQNLLLFTRNKNKKDKSSQHSWIIRRPSCFNKSLAQFSKIKIQNIEKCINLFKEITIESKTYNR